MKIKSLIFGAFAATLISANRLFAEELDKEISDLTAQIVNAIDQTEVKTIATLDFVDLQGDTSQLGRFIAEEISTDLVMAKKRFTVVDRANLKKIMQENKLTVSGLVDPDNAKKLGKIAGVDAIITGTVTPFEKTIRVVFKVIETDTARIVAAARGDITNTPSLDKLLGRHVIGETSESPEKASASSVGGKVKTVQIGKGLVGVLESIRLLKENNVEVYITLRNTGTKDVVVFMGNASGRNSSRNYVGDQELALVMTDDNGVRYGCDDVAGLTITTREQRSDQSKYCLFLGTNIFVVVPSSGQEQIRLAFGPRNQIGQAPKTLNFTADLRVVTDTRAMSSYQKTLNFLNCRLDEA